MSIRFRLAAARRYPCVALAALSGGATGADGRRGSMPGARGSGHLLCPNLRVGAPTDLYVERSAGGYGYGGGTLLHATSDIRSRGRGPMELRGRRYKRNWMHANQAIYRVGGGVEVFRTEAQLHFYAVGAYWGGSYWKVHNPLSMEIWSLDQDRRPLERVRTGPKVFYCLRDLERTRPMRRSPRPPRSTPAATRTRAASGCGSAPRSAGRTSIPPTTTASGSTSAACAAASPS